MTGSATAHQTLHGYSRGHRLLAASLQLPPEAESLLLTMSDFTGTRVIPGFESYLTGYPLVGTPLYAIAQTWYANEMPRPGSVWTHTLLLSEEAVAGLDLQKLHSLPFRRPTQSNAASHYTAAIDLFDSRTERMESSPTVMLDAKMVIANLYGKPDSAVVVYVQDAEHARDLFFRVWIQQWAALRCRFTFSTGSIGPRSVLKSPFDLQAAPAVERFSWGRHQETPIAEVDLLDTGLPKEKWTRILMADLTQRHARLHEFVDSFTVDVASARDRMAPLCQVFVTLSDHDEDQVGEPVRLLAKAFPEPEEASRLKRAILAVAPLPGIDINAPSRVVAQRIAEVLRSDEHAGFSSDHIDVGRMTEIIFNLDEINQSRLLGALLSNEKSTLVRGVGRGLANVMGTSQIATLGKHHAGFVHFLVEQRPALAGMSDLWRISASVRTEIIDALSVAGQDSDLARTVVDVVLRLQLHDVAEALLERLGTPGVDEIMSRMGSVIQEPSIPEAWKRAVARRHGDILHWLVNIQTKPEAAARAFSHLLDARALSTWVIPVNAAEKLVLGVQSNSEAELSRVAVFLLSKAMTERTHEWTSVLVKTFARVHQVAAGNRLSFLELVWLESCLPEVPGWKRWDKCHRLRKGLADLVLKDHWPDTVLLEAASEAGVVREVFDLLDKRGKSRDVLHRLISMVSSDNRFRHLRDLAREYN